MTTFSDLRAAIDRLKGAAAHQLAGNPSSTFVSVVLGELKEIESRLDAPQLASDDTFWDAIRTDLAESIIETADYVAAAQPGGGATDINLEQEHLILRRLRVQIRRLQSATP